MDEYEIAQRASRLPGRFADRVPADTRSIIQLMDEGGEYGELATELTAALAEYQTPVTAAERDELLALLKATEAPTDLVKELNVQD
jgi:hypothetical protein